MNRSDVKEWIVKNNAVMMLADKTRENAAADSMLVELGNTGRSIPFYAVFPGRGGDPITFDGLISQQTVLDALEKAGPSVAK